MFIERERTSKGHNCPFFLVYFHMSNDYCKVLLPSSQYRSLNLKSIFMNNIGIIEYLKCKEETLMPFMCSFVSSKFTNSNVESFKEGPGEGVV
jgi:hypothetical protein